MSKNDEEDLIKAYHEFMLAGKKTNESEEEAREAKELARQEKAFQSLLTLIEKAEKQYLRIFQQFCRVINDQWMRVDDELLDVLMSIKNIRNRIPLETACVQKLRVWKKKPNKNNDNNNSYMTCQDIRLAMDHDLLQHEYLLGAIRRLTSDLAQAVQSLERRLDDAYGHHFDVLSDLWNHKNESSTFTLSSKTTEGNDIMEKKKKSITINPDTLQLLDDMQELFVMIQRELYRKQRLAHDVLDSSCFVLTDGGSNKDNAMGNKGSYNNNIDQEEKGYHSIDFCCKHWSSENSSQSCIDMHMLRMIMRKSSSTSTNQ